MRKSSQVLMGAMTLASVITGIQLGAHAKPSGFSPSPTPTDNNTPTETPAPTGTGTPTSSPSPKPKPTAASVSHTSDPVYYRYGVVQLTVVKSGSTITDIQLDQATATNGRSSAFSYLVSLALSAQSQSFDTSMMTGATFTTDAFVQALDNALNQF